MENLKLKQTDPCCISNECHKPREGKKKEWTHPSNLETQYLTIYFKFGVEGQGDYKHPEFFLSRFGVCNPLDEIIDTDLLWIEQKNIYVILRN